MSDQPLVEREDNAAQLFKDMAARIEHNQASVFSGAVVVVPPDGSEPISLLMLDSSRDLAQFWGTLKTRVDMEVSKLSQVAHSQRAFGGR